MSTISFPDWINSLSPQSTDGKEVYQQDGSTPSRGDLDDKASLSAINNDPEFYEQGTVDINIIGSSSGSLEIDNIKWVRVGNNISVILSFVADLSGFSGDISITGLPFVVNKSTTSLITHGDQISYPSGGTTLFLFADAGTNNVRFRVNGSGISEELNASNISGNSGWRGTLTYNRQI